MRTLHPQKIQFATRFNLAEGLAACLESEYTRKVPPAMPAAVLAIAARGGAGEELLVCTWWAGATGTVPGSASGSQAMEAFHRPWQVDIAAMGKPANIEAARAPRRSSGALCGRGCGRPPAWTPELGGPDDDVQQHSQYSDLSSPSWFGARRLGGARAVRRGGAV